RDLTEAQLTTELGYLRAQINPHFLFNTLNNLFSIAQRDSNENLATAISRLSGLMRYMLYESHVNRVTLEREITHVRDFIGLAGMRYTEQEAEVRFQITGDVQKAMIAPMLLLPFVENAFKHGVRVEEKSIIRIEIEAVNSTIVFLCSNG